MDIQDRLLFLEEKINKLLSDYSYIKNERDMLIIQHNELKKHIDVVETENALLKSNKATVKKRIESMLEKLEA